VVLTEKCVFLDRDGVINQDPPHYAHRIDQLNIIPGSAEAIRLLNEKGFIVIVITNQSGVARGMYNEEDIAFFHAEMQRRLNENNAHIDAFYYCPHHPEAVVDKYRIDCECRKPKTGMILKAAKDFGFDPSGSFLVGDKWFDVIAGKDAGCKTILVMTGHGRDEYQRERKSFAFIAKDLLSAVKEIILEENI
jgi:D-glycero-D-manno-heptose 1,7-bisphosphate phosphatase